MFVGKEKELKQLNSAFSSQNKELGVIYGRRRIGKTHMFHKINQRFISSTISSLVFVVILSLLITFMLVTFFYY